MAILLDESRRIRYSLRASQMANSACDVSSVSNASKLGSYALKLGILCGD